MNNKNNSEIRYLAFLAAFSKDYRLIPKFYSLLDDANNSDFDPYHAEADVNILILVLYTLKSTKYLSFIDYFEFGELLEKSIEGKYEHLDLDKILSILGRILWHEIQYASEKETSSLTVCHLANIFGKIKDSRVMIFLEAILEVDYPIQEMRGNYGYDYEKDYLRHYRLAVLEAAIQLLDFGGKSIVLSSLYDFDQDIHDIAAEACVKNNFTEVIPNPLEIKFEPSFRHFVFNDEILEQLGFPINEKITNLVVHMIYDEEFSDYYLPELSSQEIHLFFQKYIELDIARSNFYKIEDLLLEYVYILDTFSYYKLIEVVKKEDIDNLFTKNIEKEKALNLYNILEKKSD